MTWLFAIVEWACAIFWGFSLFILFVTTVSALFQRRAAARRPLQSVQPPVSVIIPIKALEEGFIEAQSSALKQNYPHFDVTICAHESESPAVESARAVLAAHPSRPSRLTRSTANFAASPKINNLAEAIESAAHDLLLTKDSNIILSPEALASAVGCLKANVGLVAGVPEARHIVGFPSKIEGSVMNESHGRLLLAAAAWGLGFGVGKTLLFRRSDFLRAGGFPAISHSVGEDAVLERMLAEIGLRTVFMGPPIVQKLGRRGMKDVFERQMRWTVVRRQNALISFLIEPFGLCACAAPAAALAAPLLGLSPMAAAALTLTLWFAAETALAAVRGWTIFWNAPLVMIARDCMMLYIWLRALFTKKVVWAAAVYDGRRVK